MQGLKIRFPKKFYWGASTSAHQVEGGLVNDWARWEKKNAERLAREAGDCWQDWQKEKFPEMLKSENYISGQAADHYNRFREDFDIVKSLHHNAHRFSIEWARVEPQEGQFDQKEIDHYKEVVSDLRRRNIEPFITLWHFTNPLWFTEQGGWLCKKAPKYFERFAVKMAKELPDIKFWVTLNEPTLYSNNCFGRGVWPPNIKNIFKLNRAVLNFIKAHRKCYRSLHKINPNFKVGISENCSYFDGGWLRYLARYFINQRFFDAIRCEQDFIGLQYYFHNRLKGFKYNQNENKEITDMGWEIFPEGIYHVLCDLKKYKKPVYVTENGLADIDDKKREAFIKNHLQWVHKAIEEDVKVKGYFYWSLLDNFEWDKGFWPRFGLVEVDYQTLQRRIRSSAEAYAQICKTNTLNL